MGLSEIDKKGYGVPAGIVEYTKRLGRLVRKPPFRVQALSDDSEDAGVRFNVVDKSFLELQEREHLDVVSIVHLSTEGAFFGPAYKSSEWLRYKVNGVVVEKQLDESLSVPFHYYDDFQERGYVCDDVNIGNIGITGDLEKDVKDKLGRLRQDIKALRRDTARNIKFFYDRTQLKIYLFFFFSGFIVAGFLSFILIVLLFLGLGVRT